MTAATNVQRSAIDDVLAGRSRWALVHGDCAEVLATLPDKSVDHIITDPPYSEKVHGNSRSGKKPGVGLHNGTGRATNRITTFGFAHLSSALRGRVAVEAARLSRRWSLVFSDAESTWLWRLSLGAAGLDYVRTGAWEKLGATPQFTGDRPAAAFEAITIAHQPGRKRWNGGGRHAMWSFTIARHNACDRLHTTQKPVDLMLALVADFTDPDDIILDPFAGSATTGIACLRLGRRFVGIEKDAKFYADALARLEAEDNGQTLHAARAGQVPLFGKGAASPAGPSAPPVPSWRRRGRRARVAR